MVGLYADVNGAGTLGYFDNLAKLDPVTVWQGEQFTVDVDLALAPGALVRFDIATDGYSDSLQIAGGLLAGGLLEVTLDSTLSPLVDLAAGQSWDLFDFSTAAGVFAWRLS